MFLVIVGFIFLVGFVILLRICSRKYKLVNRLYTNLKNKIFFNAILRSLVEGSLQFAINALISMYTLNFSNKSQMLSSLMAVITMVIAIIYPALIYFVLSKYFKRLEEDAIKIRCSAIYEGLNIRNKLSMFYYVIFTFRRLIYAIAAVCLKGFPFFQIMMLFMQCVLILIYLGLVRPFETPRQNKLEMFNEICIVIVCYHLLLFTDYMSDPIIQYQIGWSIIIFTLLNIAANLSLVLIDGVKTLWESLKKLKDKIVAFSQKYNKAQKYQDGEVETKKQEQNDQDNIIRNQNFFDQIKNKIKQEQKNDIQQLQDIPYQDKQNKFLRDQQPFDQQNYSKDQFMRFNNNNDDKVPSFFENVKKQSLANLVKDQQRNNKKIQSFGPQNEEEDVNQENTWFQQFKQITTPLDNNNSQALQLFDRIKTRSKATAAAQQNKEENGSEFRFDQLKIIDYSAIPPPASD